MLKICVFIFVMYSSNILAMKDRVLYDPQSGHIGESVFKLDLLGDFHLSSGVYDTDGTEVEFNDEQGYKKFDGEANIHYGVNKYIEMFTGIRGRYIISDTEANQVTNANIESAMLGLKVAMIPTKKFEGSLYTKFRKSLFTNETDLTLIANGEAISLGNEGNELTFGGAVTYYLGNAINIYVDGAYNLPPDGLSAEVLYKGEIAFLGTSFAGKVGMDGIYSMNQEDVDIIKTPLGSEPSRFFNQSINRSRMRPYIGFNLKLGNQWRFEANAFKVISGTSTDAGIGGFGAITYYSKSDRAKLSKGREAKFKEYDTEGTILKVTSSQKFVKIDQGVGQDVSKGMKADIYLTDYFGGNILLATGVILETSANWSIIKVIRKYRKTLIKKGMTARIYK